MGSFPNCFGYYETIIIYAADRLQKIVQKQRGEKGFGEFWMI
jgi:hypothetical protein